MREEERQYVSKVFALAISHWRSTPTRKSVSFISHLSSHTFQSLP